MITYVMDLTANEMNLADASTKVSSYRMYSKDESMICSALRSWKPQTVKLYSVWSPWSNDLVKSSL